MEKYGGIQNALYSPLAYDAEGKYFHKGGHIDNFNIFIQALAIH
jgi:hypothetical protein